MTTNTNKKATSWNDLFSREPNFEIEEIDAETSIREAIDNCKKELKNPAPFEGDKEARRTLVIGELNGLLTALGFVMQQKEQ